MLSAVRRTAVLSTRTVGAHVAAASAVAAGSPGAAPWTVNGASARVVVTGAFGQIGTELVPFLRQALGDDAVLASDTRVGSDSIMLRGPFEFVDVTDRASIERVVVSHRANTIIHLASLLSATGEKDPFKALFVNSRGVENVLAVAAAHGTRVFSPSSIAVFGPTTPREATPNDTIMRPSTVYGVTKVYGELLGEYFSKRFGVDFRAIRYPGVISAEAPPGGGTTDYAVDIYHQALTMGEYKCFLKPGTVLPMLYMPDLLHGTCSFIFAPRSTLSTSTYNLTGMSFGPEEIAAAITKRIPSFKVTYEADFRQKIAESWPRTIDDSLARSDWGWKPEYDLGAMTDDMLKALRPKYAKAK